jgi:aromatic ring-opening dioxygenase LigB subunit
VLFLQTSPKDHRGTDVIVVISPFGFVLEHDLQLFLQVSLLGSCNQQMAEMILRVLSSGRNKDNDSFLRHSQALTCVTRGLTFETKGEIIDFSGADRSFARKT